MSGLPGRSAPVLGRAVVAGLVVVTCVVAVAAWVAPLIPAGSGRGWLQVRDDLVVDSARGVPSWWTVVLFTVVALACHLQASAEWARRGPRRATAVAWWAVALGIVYVSADHALGFHGNDAPAMVGGALPEPLASHPVEVLLVLLLAVPALVVVVGGSWWQRVLVPLAGLLYLAGQVVVGTGVVQLGLSQQRSSVVEVSLEWAAALVLLAAASAGRSPVVRGPGGDGRTEVEPPAPLAPLSAGSADAVQ